MLVSELSEYELQLFSTLERISSVLSLLGVLWVMFTFLGFKSFHKPINRMVFYASLGNVFAAVATIISRDALRHLDSPLCQFQGLLIQTFLPADAAWTFAMAMNVMLTFYYRYGAEDLRRLEKYYFALCYGLPLIPGLAFIWIQTPSKGHMYGNAVLWCWISAEWDIFRVAVFYGPVWAIILATIIIYLRCGKDIFAKRQQLRNFRAPPPDPIPIVHDPFSAQQSTQIRVDKHIIITESENMDIDLEQLNIKPDNSIQRPTATANLVNIYASDQPRSEHMMSPVQSYPSWPAEKIENSRNPVAGSTLMSPTVPTKTVSSSNIIPTRRYASMEANTAMYSYTKVAVLFFVAMMITWIPSSANRVYSVVNKNEVSLTLNYVSAVVLPLQGFWNAAIYTTTSWPAVLALWKQVKSGKRASGSGLRTMAAAFSAEGDKQASRNSTSKTDKYSYETDSVTELRYAGPGQDQDRPSTENSH